MKKSYLFLNMFVVGLIFCFIVTCTKTSDDDDDDNNTAATATPTVAPTATPTASTGFQITSSAFNTGGDIPTKYTCDGEDISPPLAWANPPEGVQSYALLMYDVDAGNFHHWLAYDIPTSVMHLDENVTTQADTGVFKQANNDFGKFGYGGPCPPSGSGVHRYYFQLWALDVETLGLPAGADYYAVEAQMGIHVISTTELIGKYER
ncbi:YbhB/YbcL family Raf kinase inhibitor-like protein [candidate division CSSED10-310 bacterium]|uniref:YbhB/YbcL family Raf kinase inhibitor-like protein n=1 Tax=candidate division CSSED10-310 bacterium TaxID=2855610 RepID=A0ABV6YX57_UNCC1